jgi:DNA-binding CsgD family transcriptional regulator
LSEQGKTGEEIAKALGISAPSVQNVRKALGLVKSRTKTAPAEAAPVADVAPAL